MSNQTEIEVLAVAELGHYWLLLNQPPASSQH